MSAQILIEECRSSGVLIRLDGGKIKLRGPDDAVAVALEKLKPHKQEIIRHLLDQFQFELIEQDANPSELHRINNMAWEFMQSDGMAFSAAIKTAAEIVAHTCAAKCEAAYLDVFKLWEKTTSEN